MGMTKNEVILLTYLIDKSRENIESRIKFGVVDFKIIGLSLFEYETSRNNLVERGVILFEYGYFTVVNSSINEEGIAA